MIASRNSANSPQRNSAEDNFSVRRTTKKGTLPRVPFLALKNAVLGEDYDLSLVFASPTLSRKLNRTHRDKDKPANVLSFPLTKTSGELFLDLETARKEAPLFDRAYTNFIAFLFIHGLFHLKGFEHSGIMERKERVVRKTFGI